ncbi:hypothetical protein R5R35_003740 [Gryllus longicercus]|uniref:Protein-lysine N-methyltransferase SMYD4 n=1 Tax=Gryllus longicercus TaxID=2509291 RepID=A0AAN9ZDB9_9ORTH
MAALDAIVARVQGGSGAGEGEGPGEVPPLRDAVAVRDAAPFDAFLERVRGAAQADAALLPAFARLASDRARVDFVYALEGARDLAPAPCFAAKDDADAKRLLALGDRLLHAEAAAAAAGGGGGGAAGERALAHYCGAVRAATPGGRVLARAFVSRARAWQRAGRSAEAAQDAARGAQLWEAAAAASPSAADAADALAALRLRVSCCAALGLRADAQDALRRASDLLRAAPLDKAAKARGAADLAAALKDAPQPKGPSQEQEASKGRGQGQRKGQGRGGGGGGGEDEEGPPPLDYGRSAALPAASDAVRVAWARGRGRHLLARRDIALGSVLIAERPYAWSLSTEAMTRRCLHCCRLLRASLPCPHCSTVSYCSPECQEAAWKTYHYHECKILNHFLQSKELSKMALLAFRIVVTARIGGLRDAPEGPSAEPAKLASQEDCRGDESLGAEGKDVKTPFLSQAYSSVLGQIANSECRPPGDFLKRTATAVFLARCLRDAVASPEQERQLAAAILRHLQSCSCNAYQISEQRLPGGNLTAAEDVEVGGAAYPTVSLSNHSCYPNVARYSYGNVCVVRACRKIYKDEEILDNYGQHFLTEPREARQAYLKAQYFFDCACQACAGLWPTAVELRSAAAQYKCVHCGQALGQALAAIRACPHCRKKLDYKAAAKKLKDASREYASALEQLARGRPKECLKAAAAYAALLQPLVAPPSAELARWLQVVAHCWGLLANTHVVPGE